MSYWPNLRAAVLAGLALVLGAQAVSARTVEHAMGSTEVPDSPQRVVVLTNEGTEALLALGVTPVGAVKSWLGDPWYPHIAESMADAQVVGDENAINLEVVAALQPDLIIGNKLRQEKIYAQLSAIAPTVFSETLRGEWQINFDLYADAVGKEAEGQALVDEFDARLQAIRQGLGDRVNEEISLVRFMPSQTRIYLKDTFAGVILDRIGFKRPANQDRPEFADNVTKERIPEMEGDRLFYYVYEPGQGDALKTEAEWMAEPLWQNLEVVKSGKVHRVEDAVWNTSGGILAANRLLDDLAAVYGLK